MYIYIYILAHYEFNGARSAIGHVKISSFLRFGYIVGYIVNYPIPSHMIFQLSLAVLLCKQSAATT